MSRRSAAAGWWAAAGSGALAREAGGLAVGEAKEASAREEEGWEAGARAGAASAEAERAAGEAMG